MLGADRRAGSGVMTEMATRVARKPELRLFVAF